MSDDNSFIPLFKKMVILLPFLDFAITNLTFTAKHFKPHTDICIPSSRENPDIPCPDHVEKHTCRMSVSIRVSDKHLIERIEREIDKPEYSELTLH